MKLLVRQVLADKRVRTQACKEVGCEAGIAVVSRALKPVQAGHW